MKKVPFFLLLLCLFSINHLAIAQYGLTLAEALTKDPKEIEHLTIDMDKEGHLLPQLPTLKYLTRLGLRHVHTFPEVLLELPQLKTLTIYESDMTELPHLLYVRMWSLKHLTIHAKLKTLSPNLFSRSLKSIDLSDNELTDFADITKQWGILGNSLEELKLANNQITRMPEDMVKLSALKHLDLRTNKLAHIPEDIGKLSLLKYFLLGKNALVEIPSNIGELKLLEELELSENKITNLPKSIGGLTSLKKFFINDNLLVSLPSEMANLQTLEQLYLENNLIAKLSIPFGSMLALQWLEVTNNPIEKIDISLFAGKTKEWFVILKQTKIKKQDLEALKNKQPNIIFTTD